MENTVVKKWLGFAIMFALVVGTLAFVSFVHSYGENSPTSNRTFSVSSEGKAVVVPDVAQFTFSVVSQGGKDLAALQKQNTDKVNASIAFVKSKGVDDKDISTVGYDVQPQYTYSQCTGNGPCPPPQISGYSITQTVQVKARKFDAVGDLLSGVVSAGANSVSSLTFTRDNPEDAKNLARADAISKAREQADVLAKAGGFHIGRLVSVNEEVAGGPIPYGMGGLGAAADMKTFSTQNAPAAPSPSIQPGSQEVDVTMTLTYEIR